MVSRVYHEGTVARVRFLAPNMVLTATQQMLRIWTSGDYQRVTSPIRIQYAHVTSDKHRVKVATTKANATQKPELGQVSIDMITVNDESIMTVISNEGKWVLTGQRGEETEPIELRLRTCATTMLNSTKSSSWVTIRSRKSRWSRFRLTMHGWS